MIVLIITHFLTSVKFRSNTARNSAAHGKLCAIIMNHQMQKESALIIQSSDFGYLYPFWRYSQSRVWDCPKHPQILHLLGPTFFKNMSSKFWDRDYTVQPASDHVAKFHSNQPRP